MTAKLRRSRTLGFVALATMLIGLLAAAVEPAQAASKRSAKPTLKRFASCTSLVRYARHNARRTGGRTGVPTRVAAAEPLVLGSPGPATAEPMAALSAQAARGGADEPDFSGTNIQEVGVDEPDIVKTDGRRVFAVSDGTLRALDVTGPAPRLVGSLELEGPGAHQLFLRGNRLLVMTTTYGGPQLGAPADVVGAPQSKVVLTEIDVGDPEAMVLRRTMTLDAGLVDARLTGSMARIVVASSPDPIPRAKISRAGMRRFVPRSVLRSKVSGRTFKRSVAPCRSIRRPRSFSGLDLVTVLTIDLDKGLFDVDRDAIVAGAQNVYASTGSLYVASRRYDRALEAGRALPSRSVTEIHRFEATSEGTTAYRSSGQVSGFVLNQFALSEHDGHLRVASTDEPEWFPDGSSRRQSESFVTVLDERGSKLVRVGGVDGLGKGEEIYAVRFAGDKGYVVTFRQVDPLYTLDLSQPTRPRVAGELKIRGYSAYLHPISDDLLLGVGQDATERGVTLGVQLSLFDVSDPAKPVRRAHTTVADTDSETEFDHHAFLFWKPANLAVIPLWGYDPRGSPEFDGAIGFRVGGTTLPEAGRITHPSAAGADGYPPSIARSLVIGERLYTLSYAGLGANRLDTLGPLSFTAFPAPS